MAGLWLRLALPLQGPWVHIPIQRNKIPATRMPHGTGNKKRKERQQCIS